jgi:hypothetical protein
MLCERASQWHGARTPARPVRAYRVPDMGRHHRVRRHAYLATSEYVQTSARCSVAPGVAMRALRIDVRAMPDRCPECGVIPATAAA